VILGLLENKPELLEVSILTGLPAETVRAMATNIFNILMFNRGRDPYISLGLSGRASPDEMRKRWKRLLLLQSGSSFGHEIREETIRRINEAYIEAGERGRPTGWKRTSAGPRRIMRRLGRSSRHLRHAHGLIAGIIFFFAFLSIVAFFMRI
jgi:hypothetical protein